MKCLSFLVCLAVLGLAVVAPAAQPILHKQVLFKKGDGGYHTYRIPALVVSKKGTVLAFVEARKNSGSDHGDIDLMIRRSEDHGRTWSRPQIILDGGKKTIGNPCPVVDRKTGTIWLPLSRDNRQVLLMKSDDDGRTWSEPQDITADVLPKNWGWVGPGPGHGIQLKSGRLLIPCWAGVEKNVPFGKTQLSYVFFSDDGGKQWKLGGSLDKDLSDECEVVELANGTVYMNARSRQNKRRRAYSHSKDGGVSWSAVRFEPKLPEPSVQGSIIRFSYESATDKNRVVLATPAHPRARTMMTVRISYDECKTWPVSRVVHEGGAAYSDLAVTRDRQILLLYEADQYATITLARFNLEWISRGHDKTPGRKSASE